VAKLAFTLEEKEIATFNLTYTHGRTRSDLTKVEKFGASLGIKF